MAVSSATRKGRVFDAQYGLLGYVYTGAWFGATALGANTAVQGILVGTPVGLALPVDSIVISNEVADGDIAIYGNSGGNSQQYMLIDVSGGTITFDNANVVIGAGQSLTVTDTGLTITAGGITVNGGDLQLDAASDIIKGSATQTTTSDGDGSTNLIPGTQLIGVNAVAEGSLLIANYSTTNTRAAAPHFAFLKGGAATQVSTTAVADNEVIGSLIWYGTDATDALSPVAAIEAVINGTVGTGDMPGSLEVSTTADGGETLTLAVVVDTAQDVHLQTDSLTNLYFGAGDDATLGHDGTSLVLDFPQTTDEFVINEVQADVNFRLESNTLANIIYMDAGIDSLQIASQSATISGSLMVIGGEGHTRTRAASTTEGVWLEIGGSTMTLSNTSGTLASLGTVSLQTMTVAAAGATTLTDAAALWIQAAATAGSNITITNAYAIQVEAGNSFFGGNIKMGTDSVFSSTEGTNGILFGSGTAPDGTATTAGQLYSDDSGDSLSFEHADGTEDELTT